MFIGEDDYGNSYYEARDASDSYDGRKRRWVIYRGYAEASKVPAEWHGWLHYTFDEPPTVAPLTRKVWEKDHMPEPHRHDRWPGGRRARSPAAASGQAASGDYEAWRPE